jgi:hypothetical protein
MPRRASTLALAVEVGPVVEVVALVVVLLAVGRGRLALPALADVAHVDGAAVAAEAHGRLTCNGCK